MVLQSDFRSVSQPKGKLFKWKNHFPYQCEKGSIELFGNIYGMQHEYRQEPFKNKNIFCGIICWDVLFWKDVWSKYKLM